MIPAAERNAQQSTETFGLSHGQTALIAKLRLGLVPADVHHQTPPHPRKGSSIMPDIEDAEIALSDLAELPIAVTPATYVTKVDPQEIGRSIAGWDSTAQAAFLTGLAEGFTDIGPNYGLQLTYIGYDLAKMPDQAKTRYFIEILASYLKEN